MTYWWLNLMHIVSIEILSPKTKENRKQCVRINGTRSYLGDIISGVPQGSILGSILNNPFETVHNFADDNTLACFSKTIQELIGSLKSEYEVDCNWFNENKMIVNQGKFQDIIIDSSSSSSNSSSSSGSSSSSSNIYL